MLHRLLFVAIVAGSVAGLATSAVQEAWAVPLILEAEGYETPTTHGGMDAAAHDHASGHDHADTAWAPADGFERMFWTALTNVGLGIGIGLLLAALFLMRGRADWRTGLVWGAVGYLAVAIAPALGLPPELPGTEAASVEGRQAWWLLTVGCTFAAFMLFHGSRHWSVRIGAVGLLLFPHLVGAPQPEVHTALVPSMLQREFIAAALSASLVFWLVLGPVAGGLFARAFRPADEDSPTGVSHPDPIQESTPS